MPITINGSTGISGVDGSTGTPAVIGSDADTGLVFAAGRVSASINGTAANVGLVQGTAQNSTSGTNIDFTGIPSWVKRITVMLSGVSTSGTSLPLVQLGDSGGIENTGYISTSNQLAVGNNVDSSTAGFVIRSATVTNVLSGSVIIQNISGNEWVSHHVLKQSTGGVVVGGGDKTLSGTLTQLRITTVNGTDTFDAGSINILYEG